MTKARPKQKQARAPKIIDFDSENFDRNAEKAKEQTGLDPITEGLTDEELTVVDRHWPINGPMPLESARARAKSRPPKS